MKTLQKCWLSGDMDKEWKKTKPKTSEIRHHTVMVVMMGVCVGIAHCLAPWKPLSFGQEWRWGPPQLLFVSWIYSGWGQEWQTATKKVKPAPFSRQHTDAKDLEIIVRLSFFLCHLFFPTCNYIGPSVGFRPWKTCTVLSLFIENQPLLWMVLYYTV